MGEASEAARAVIAQFGRDGFVAQESAERAEFGVWDRVTPARVLLVALQTVLQVRREEGRTDIGRPVPGLDEEDAERLVGALLGEPVAAQEAELRGLITLDRLVGTMASVIAEESMSEDEVGVVLAAAEESCRAVGPWDERDARRPRDGQLVDLGGLLVPTEPGVEIKPMRSKDGSVAGVTVVRGRTAIQLQAFRALSDTSWATIREQLSRSLLKQGGLVEERVGRAGTELQAVVRVQGASGKDRQTARVLGSDGPGWVLRGFVTGAGAEPDSTEDWPHTTFQGTVVRPPSAPQGTDTLIRLRRPESQT